MSRLRARDDDGSVLVMALIFLSLIGIVVAAVLGFANTGLKTASAVHTTTKAQYTADAAIEGAINAIRSDVNIGKDSNGVATACFNLVATEVNATAVDVSCTGRDGSGATTGGAGGGLFPANSVLTLPTDANEGVTLSTTATPLVTGDVATDEVLSVPAGATLTVQGALTCKTRSVTGTVTATTTTACPSAASTSDPNYNAAIVSRPVAATLPASCAGATVSFSPGWYSSATALNGFTNGAACTSKLFHFTPGVYYFEFADVGAHLWTINDATSRVVGGTLTAPATAFPNECDLASAGVQFIFGSDSRLAVTAGSLELCPPLSAGQRIAVYGAKTTGGTPPTTPVIAATTATDPPVPPAPARDQWNQNGTVPQNGAVIDGVEAEWFAQCNKCTSTLTLTGFSNTAVPTNAVISSASLSVASRKSSAGDATLTVVAGDGATQAYGPYLPCIACTPASAAYTVAFDVSALINTPARANGITVRYRADDQQGNPRMRAWVDGITLSVTYTIPGLAGTSGLALGTPYSPATATTTTYPVLRGTGGASAKMAIKGTIYAPLGAVDLSMTGQLNAVTQRGVIARTLHLGVNHGAPYTGALLAMPGSANRQVLLTATIGGSPKLRADVTIDDGLGATPGTTVTVDSWSVLR